MTDDSELPQDQVPQSDDARTKRCPECGETFGGLSANLSLGRHRKAKHPEEWASGRAPAAKKKAPAAKKAPQDRPPRAPSVSREVEQNVTLFYGVVSDLWTMRGDPCGLVLHDCVPGIAHAWGDLAKTNDAVRQFWTGGGGAASWLGLALAHAPVAMAIFQVKVQPRLDQRRAAHQAMMEGDAYGPTPETVVNGRAVPTEPEPSPREWPRQPV